MAPSPFDYGAVEPAERDALRASADRIRDRMSRMTEGIIEIGVELIAVKERIGHGNFLPWVAAEFLWEERTARNYMSAATAFGGNRQRVADLAPGVVYALAAAPEPIREAVLSQVTAGEASTPFEVRRLIKEARDEGREETRRAKLPPAQRRRIEASQKADERAALARKQVLEERARLAGDLVSLLRGRLGDEFDRFVREFTRLYDDGGGMAFFEALGRPP